MTKSLKKNQQNFNLKTTFVIRLLHFGLVIFFFFNYCLIYLDNYKKLAIIKYYNNYTTQIMIYSKLKGAAPLKIPGYATDTFIRLYFFSSILKINVSICAQ